MEISGWNKRYELRERPDEDFNAAPTPLVVATAEQLAPGRALDLACGTGRNAIWLAEHGWKVTAVDGATRAIETLRERAGQRGLKILAGVADLEVNAFAIGDSRWDLVAICYYLQRDLFERAKRGLAPGGVAIAIVHVSAPEEPGGPYRLRPGELEKYFEDWEILHSYEGPPNDSAHRRAVAEIVARRPAAK